MKNIIIPILLIFSFSGYCNEQKDSLYKESVIRKLRIVNDSIDSLNQKFYKLSNEVTDLKGKTISRETIISFTSVLIAFLLLVLQYIIISGREG